MKPILAKDVVELLQWLGEERVKLLAAGEAASAVFPRHPAASPGVERFYDLASALNLSYEDNQVCNPLTAQSRADLAYHFAHQDDPIRDEDLLPLRASNALDEGHVVKRLWFYELPRELATEYAGRHAHGQMIHLRNRLGQEEIVWHDGEPTKGGAWNTQQIVTDPRILALFKLAESKIGDRALSGKRTKP